MASQSDARLFMELKERLDKVEELLQMALDKLQQLISQDQDLMPVMYPGPPAEDKEAC